MDVRVMGHRGRGVPGGHRVQDLEDSLLLHGAAHVTQQALQQHVAAGAPPVLWPCLCMHSRGSNTQLV